MITKAERLAKWAIIINIAHPVLLILLYFLNGFFSENVTGTIFIFCIYLIIPVLLINWILSIWSLILQRSMKGFWAILFTIIYTCIFVIIFYILTTVKMC